LAANTSLYLLIADDKSVVQQQRQENMMTRNNTIAAILAYVVATGAATSMVMSPSFAGPAEEAAQDYEGWRAAQKATAEQQSQTQQAQTRNGISHAFRGEALAPRAKIGLPQARATALAARPGRVVDEELEHERGGSGLRYSFDIKNGSVTYEVGVDAMTGRVLENGVDRD
jgi:uncharacterized membrane protein YkoI